MKGDGGGGALAAAEALAEGEAVGGTPGGASLASGGSSVFVGALLHPDQRKPNRAKPEEQARFMRRGCYL
jgi:hypothetical protein